MCCDGKDAHTTHEHGTGELGHWALNQGAGQGQGCGLGGGDVSELRGNGGEDDDLWDGSAGTTQPP